MVRLLPVALVVAAARVGMAEPAAQAPIGMRTYVATPPSMFTARAASSSISPFIYLNRCTGGCTVNGSASINDARSQTSTIPIGSALSCAS